MPATRVPFINVKDDANWLLLLGYIFAAMQPHGPYPLLALFGEQGTAKTTLGRLVQKIIDPRQGDLRSEPKGNEDLYQLAVICYHEGNPLLEKFPQ